MAESEKAYGIYWGLLNLELRIPLLETGAKIYDDKKEGINFRLLLPENMSVPQKHIYKHYN